MPETLTPPAPPTPEDTPDAGTKVLQYEDGQLALGYNEPESSVRLGPDSDQKWARNLGEGGDMAVIFTQQGNVIGVGEGAILDAGNRQFADMPGDVTVDLEVGKPVTLPGIASNPDDPIDAIVLRYKTTGSDEPYEGADQVGTSNPFNAMKVAINATRAGTSEEGDHPENVPVPSNKDSLQLIEEVARKSVTAERWLAKHYKFDNPNPGELTMKVDKYGRIPLYEAEGGETPEEVYQKLAAFEGLDTEVSTSTEPEPASTSEPHVDTADTTTEESAEELIDNPRYRENLELLRAQGDLGRMFADLYEAAVEDEPALADIVVNVGGAKTNKTLAGTGGFARHKDETTSGKYEITVNTDDGIDHYQRLMHKRKRSAEASAIKAGISPENLTPEQLATFIFLHELGHIVDYTKNAPDKATRDARRKIDMDKLPVPGLNPVALEQKLNTKGLRKWFFSQTKHLKKTYGVSSLDELLKAQEVAYHDSETEDIPDQFAARIMKRLGMTEPVLAAA